MLKLNSIFKFILYASTIVGGSAVFVDYFDFSAKASTTINHIFVGIILLVLLIFCGIREWMNSRKQVYANITSYYHYCLHEIRNLNTYINQKIENTYLNEDGTRYANFDMEDFQKIVHDHLKRILTYFANIFFVLTGTKCRACIKSIHENNERLYVFTQARDDMSSKLCHQNDKDREQNNKDPLDRNTDFHSLYFKFDPSYRCFFANDLTSTTHYDSTSFDTYGHPSTTQNSYIDNVPILNKFKNVAWPLPYKSAIVWPIQQKNEPNLSLKNPVCVGFLAIDSESRNVFNKNWDFELGAGLADSLYHALQNFSYILRNTKTKEDGNETESR